MLLSLSTLPIVILLAYIYWRDKFEREPIGQLAKAFVGGVLTVVCVLIVTIPISAFEPESPLLNGLFNAFFVAAIPEEGFKFLFLYLFIWKSKAFNEYFDGIVYAVFVSLGFACVENIMYLAEYGTDIATGRAIFAVPAHFLFGVTMGYYFSLAKFRNQSLYLTFALGGAIFFHGIYDTILFWSSSLEEIAPMISSILYIGFLVFDILLWRQGIRKIKQLTQIRICPVCNGQFNNNETFCPNCGNELK